MIRIRDYLPPNGSTISRRELLERTGLQTRQDLSRLVLYQRRHGEPIGSNQDGYYLIETKEQMLAFCGRLRHRAGEIFKTRRACLETAEHLPSEDSL